MLINLRYEDKLMDSDDIDSLISAEIPDLDEQPRLYNVVKSCMLHGPCGTKYPHLPCMQNDDKVCSKGFPKKFCPETIPDVNGYPLYRRCNDDRSIIVKGEKLDNRSVVPYCPWLSLKYNAHINLEACSSVKSVKYLHKYIYKGHDCAKV